MNGKDMTLMSQRKRNDATRSYLIHAPLLPLPDWRGAGPVTHGGRVGVDADA